MKKGVIAALGLFLILCSIGLVAFAEDIPEAIPLPDVRWLGQDPCTTADRKYDLTLLSSQNMGCNVTECSLILTYSMSSNGTTAAYWVNNYHRVTLDGDNYVTVQNTMLVPGLGAIFGRGYNSGAGMLGTIGVIDAAVFSTADRAQMSGTFLVRSYDGVESFCFWQDPTNIVGQ